MNQYLRNTSIGTTVRLRHIGHDLTGFNFPNIWKCYNILSYLAHISFKMAVLLTFKKPIESRVVESRPVCLFVVCSQLIYQAFFRCMHTLLGKLITSLIFNGKHKNYNKLYTYSKSRLAHKSISNSER